MRSKRVIAAVMLLSLPVLMAGQVLTRQPPVLPATTEDQTTLIYLFSDGQETEAEVTMDLSMEEGDPPQRWFGVSYTFSVTCAVELVYDDGSADMLAVIDRVRVRDRATTFGYYDSDVAADRTRKEILAWSGVLDVPMRFVVDSDGELYDLDTDPLVDALARSMGRALTVEEQAAAADQAEFTVDPILKSLFHRLSWDPVSSGSAYESNKRAVLVAGVGALLVGHSHSVKSISADTRLAVIETTGRAEAASVTLKRLEDSGWFLFDNEIGRVLQSYDRLSAAFTTRANTDYSLDLEVRSVVSPPR